MGEEFVVFLVVLTICATFVALKALKLKYQRDKSSDPEDARTMQEINRGLQRMEDRIEALETLVIDDHDRAKRRRFNEELR